MRQDAARRLELVRAYHDRTKHHPERYARSLGYMDWANQPDPFRTFAGAPRLALDHPPVRALPSYDDLYGEPSVAAPLDRAFVSRLFYHSLALSAWKQASHSEPWSLRINPSSGALHPTEGYLIGGAVPGLVGEPGIFHYSPYHHALECRARLSPDGWRLLSAGLPAPCVLVGLTSIYWRESWKYGERAFRYCHHDVGHALGAVTIAARTLGWTATLLDMVSDDDLNRLLGTHTQRGIEAEHGDCLLALFPTDPDRLHEEVAVEFGHDLRRHVSALEFTGQPNPLSREHQQWPVIDEVARAAVWNGGPERHSSDGSKPHMTPISLPAIPERRQSAEQVIRQRRSAVAMDGRTPLSRAEFYRLIARTLPSSFPLATWPWAPRVSLAIFVHRIADVTPGLYLLMRDPDHEPSLRRALRTDFSWERPPECPDGLPLFRLRLEDARAAAKFVCCDQDIAADGALAIGMLAQFDASLEEHGPGIYPRLFWETGLIGQVLYLEAEAAGVRGTGIGCFFDDVMHAMLGIADHAWQSLYHFTIGRPTEDLRLQTLPPYAHLQTGRDAAD